MTNIYHISYAPAMKEVSLFFWSCNFGCRGCLCQKEISNFLLKENQHLFLEEQGEIVMPPLRFLGSKEVMRTLEGLEVDKVILEGQEASLDPQYPQITEALHKRFGSHNILCTNAYKIPSLKDTDELQIGLKAVTDSLHRHYTGKSSGRVLKNFVRLHRSGMKITASSLLIPGYIDADETENIAKFIAGVDKNIPYHILAYLKAGDNPWRRPTHDEIDGAASAARKHLDRVWGWTGDEEMEYEVRRVI